MTDTHPAPPSNRWLRWLRKAGYVGALVVLTLILFGPAVPLDMALLLASAVLFQIGFFASPATRAGIFEGVKQRIGRLLARVRAP